MLQDISTGDFFKKSHLYIDVRDRFSELFAANPFKDVTNILSIRPSIWGMNLTFIAIKSTRGGSKHALFKIDEENLPAPKLPELTEMQLLGLFPNYQDQMIGAGGQGSVFKIIPIMAKNMLSKKML